MYIKNKQKNTLGFAFFINNVTMSQHYCFLIGVIYIYQVFFYFQELDNIFSEHFGWTQNSTTAASQVADHEDSSEDADEDGPADDTNDLGHRRVMQFLDKAVLSDPN